MARPTSKTELIEASNNNYKKLIKIIDSLPNDALNASFNFDVRKLKEAHWTRDQNVKDVLIHLYEWQELLLNWIQSNQAGKAVEFLPDGYNWRNYGELNVEFWKKHENTSTEEAEKLLEGSHKQTMDLLDTFSNDDLFGKSIFPWTGNNALGVYFVANTSSHYDWALKKIRKYQRSFK